MGGFIKPGVVYSCIFFLKMGYSTKHLYCRLWDFALVVVTYSEIVILPNNHIFNLKMRQIAKILITNDFKMKKIFFCN